MRQIFYSKYFFLLSYSHNTHRSTSTYNLLTENYWFDDDKNQISVITSDTKHTHMPFTLLDIVHQLKSKYWSNSDELKLKIFFFKLYYRCWSNWLINCWHYGAYTIEARNNEITKKTSTKILSKCNFLWKISLENYKTHCLVWVLLR